MGEFIAFLLLIFFSFSAKNVAQSDAEKPQTFIVGVQNDLKPSVFPDVVQWYASTLRSVLGSNPLETTEKAKPTEIRGDETGFLHVYKTVFHGFSARLTASQAREIQNRPGVLAVLPDEIRQIHTTRSPHFLGLSANDTTNSLLAESDFGSNVIVGVFDTGIWPEHRSFKDDGLGPIPPQWKGICEEGEKFTKANCNRKIIGARYFVSGYEAGTGEFNSSVDIRSARDADGHGTHTASTATGRAVGNASFFGFANGIASGIAPKARIAVYKICWKKGCMNSDILAAFEKAVTDGVDVISISVGGGAVPYHLDPIAIGSYDAMVRGIFVSASAGNDGPGSMSVTNIAPWITTVGASTIDRKFPADLILQNGGHLITGASLYTGKPLPEKTFFPLIYAENASADNSSYLAANCMPYSLSKERIRGKIVICDRGGIPRVLKGEVVKDAGGVGVIVTNVAPMGEGITADAHVIPGLAVTESDGRAIRDYINRSPNPTATMAFRGTQVGTKPAPIVASFSSRGPSGESTFVLKPDLIAPGVNILAAWPDSVGPTELPTDTRRTEFNVASGTSMSCPHVSGLAALLKGAHPDWSPAMIRSALMTTAYTRDLDGKPLLDDTSYTKSKVWDMGAGHVYPKKAVDPGLVYDLAANDYLGFLCASNYTAKEITLINRRRISCKEKPFRRLRPWDLNYPAISVAFDQSSFHMEVVVRRTVTHVSDGASIYSVTATNPKGASLMVDPPKMNFTGKGQKQSFAVRIKAAKVEVPAGNSLDELGEVTWTDGKHRLNSPVIVVWQQPF